MERLGAAGAVNAACRGGAVDGAVSAAVAVCRGREVGDRCCLLYDEQPRQQSCRTSCNQRRRGSNSLESSWVKVRCCRRILRSSPPWLLAFAGTLLLLLLLLLPSFGAAPLVFVLCLVLLLLLLFRFRRCCFLCSVLSRTQRAQILFLRWLLLLLLLLLVGHRYGAREDWKLSPEEAEDKPKPQRCDDKRKRASE